MCRLLSVVSATPITVADAVGDRVLKDFVALAKSLGVDGEKVTNAGDIAGALQRALAAEGSYLIDVVTDPEALKSGYRFHKNLFPLPPYPSREGIQMVINQLAADDSKLKTAVAENFFDSSLLEEIKSK